MIDLCITITTFRTVSPVYVISIIETESKSLIKSDVLKGTNIGRKIRDEFKIFADALSVNLSINSDS